MKETAVEWLANELVKKGFPIEKYGMDLYEQAKEMEKEQQERRYSEEEVSELVYNVMSEYAKRENIFFKGDLINNLFEQFKKK